MTFATDMSSMALQLLTDFGRAVTCTRVTEGAYNPSTSETLAGTTTTFSGYGYPYPWTALEVDNEFILNTDMRMILSVTTKPQVGDTLVVDGSTYRIMNVGTITAQTSDVVYELQLRI